MQNSLIRLLLHGYSIFLGVIAGLFIGLFLIGSGVRVIFDLAFGWGDQGPAWVNMLISAITILTSFFCVITSRKWMKEFVEKGRAEAGQPTRER